MCGRSNDRDWTKCYSCSSSSRMLRLWYACAPELRACSMFLWHSWHACPTPHTLIMLSTILPWEKPPIIFFHIYSAINELILQSHIQYSMYSSMYHSNSHTITLNLVRTKLHAPSLRTPWAVLRRCSCPETSWGRVSMSVMPFSRNMKHLRGSCSLKRRRWQMKWSNACFLYWANGMNIIITNRGLLCFVYLTKISFQDSHSSYDPLLVRNYPYIIIHVTFCTPLLGLGHDRVCRTTLLWGSLWGSGDTQ